MTAVKEVLQYQLPTEGVDASTWTFLVLVSVVWNGPATAAIVSFATKAVGGWREETFHARIDRLLPAACLYVLALDLVPLVVGLRLGGHLAALTMATSFLLHAVVYMYLGLSLHFVVLLPGTLGDSLKRCIRGSRQVVGLLLRLLAINLLVLLASVPLSLWSEVISAIAASLGASFGWLCGAAIVQRLVRETLRKRDQ